MDVLQNAQVSAAVPTAHVKVDQRHFLCVDGVRVARVCLERRSLIFRDKYRNGAAQRYVEIRLEQLQRILQPVDKTT